VLISGTVQKLQQCEYAGCNFTNFPLSLVAGVRRPNSVASLRVNHDFATLMTAYLVSPQKVGM